MKKIEEKLLNNLKGFNLLNKKIVVGFSGGGDSTALIIALNKIQKDIPETYDTLDGNGTIIDRNGSMF